MIEEERDRAMFIQWFGVQFMPVSDSPVLYSYLYFVPIYPADSLPAKSALHLPHTAISSTAIPVSCHGLVKPHDLGSADGSWRSWFMMYTWWSCMGFERRFGESLQVRQRNDIMTNGMDGMDGVHARYGTPPGAPIARCPFESQLFSQLPLQGPYPK